MIQPSPKAVANALDGWKWLEVEGKTPILVTAFADMFMQAPDGIWFLDTYEGKLKRVCDTREELSDLLNTEKGDDLYLFGPIARRAESEGLRLGPDECYDFKVHPVLGGSLDLSNIEKRSFLVAFHLRGQLHEQVRHMAPGTKITSFHMVDDASAKPKKEWWRFW